MSGKFDLIPGQRFGAMTVVKRVKTPPHVKCKPPAPYYRCRCDCESHKVVRGDNLVYGQIISCGCQTSRAQHVESMKETHRTMVRRCTDPRRKEFKYYGAVGVRVSERWHTFENFLADMGERPPGKQLGRFLDQGNYEPGNVKWMTHAEQTEQKRLKKLAKQMAMAA